MKNREELKSDVSRLNQELTALKAVVLRENACNEEYFFKLKAQNAELSATELRLEAGVHGLEAKLLASKARDAKIREKLNAIRKTLDENCWIYSFYDDGRVLNKWREEDDYFTPLIKKLDEALSLVEEAKT